VSINLTLCLLALRSQLLGVLAEVAVERGDLDVALEFAQKARHKTRELCGVDHGAERDLRCTLRAEAHILDLLGRLDEAVALDTELRVTLKGHTTRRPRCARPSCAWRRGRMPRPSRS
jgi:hypothetical protein